MKLRWTDPDGTDTIENDVNLMLTPSVNYDGSMCDDAVFLAPGNAPGSKLVF